MNDLLRLSEDAQTTLKDALKNYMDIITQIANAYALKENKKEVSSQEIMKAINTWEACKMFGQVESIFTGNTKGISFVINQILQGRV